MLNNQGSRFKVQGSRFKVQGSRFKVQVLAIIPGPSGYISFLRRKRIPSLPWG